MRYFKSWISDALFLGSVTKTKNPVIFKLISFFFPLDGTDFYVI